MNQYKEKMMGLMNEFPEYSELLFARGYIITNNKSLNYNQYPFFGNWKNHTFGEYTVSVNKNQTYYEYVKEDLRIAIVGHAYNPFTMEYDEESILKTLSLEYKKGYTDFFEAISELTGIHLIVVKYGNCLEIVQDCAGLKSCYYGKIHGNIYISSASQMIADLNDLEMDEFVRKLVNSKCYNIGNRHLPGDITPYKEVKRLGPNTYLKYDNEFEVTRFYPVKPHNELKTEAEFKQGISNICNILNNNIKIAAKKWNSPAISLSGGTDSKTTLACANGSYDKFKFFSFYCKQSELVNAEAAGEICDNLNLTHDIYPIPENNSDIKDFEVLKQIVEHNTSYFERIADNEIRKYIFLMRLNSFDVELKSWSSEIARVFFERKYRIKMPKLLNERQYSIFQTRYFGDKSLLKKSDEIYRKFLKKIELDKNHFNFESADLAYWEVRMGAWGTAVVSSLDICHEATMPFNNRKLIEMFLEFPHDYRKLDKVHEDVIKHANRAIYDMKVEISNNYFKSYRIWLEKLFYFYRTMFFRSKM